ncbi:MAG: glycoside hydrolase family 38 C-terminal domain-containing protein, partial [Bacteroidota bacterium]
TSALRLMEELPDYRFSLSQAALHHAIKTDYPEAFRQIKQRVTEGRWEPLAGFWVECNCNLSGGESLVRHILYGKRFLQSEFGIDSTVAWLPEASGFPGTFPQILAQGGFSHLVTTRINTASVTRVPYNTFWWKGIDGSKIVTHIPPVGLEGQVTPRDLKKCWESFRQKETLVDVLSTFGSDGGKRPPSKEQFHFLQIFKEIPTLPKSRQSGAEEFFRRLEETRSSAHRGTPLSHPLPVWEGELYLDRHRGTYTTQGGIKKANRAGEILLYNAELLCSLAALQAKGGRRYPTREIEDAWKSLLLNQDHHILGGTSIEDVSVQALHDAEDVRTTGSAIVSAALSGLTKARKSGNGEFHFTVFNTLPWTRSGYVEIEAPTPEKHLEVRGPGGEILESQVLQKSKGGTRLLCYIENIPPCSGFSLTVASSRKQSSAPEPWARTNRTVDGPLFRIRIDGKGQLTSVYDKRLRRELLQKGGRANVFQTFPDKAKQWDTWDIEPEFDNRKADLFRLRSSKILHSGPICTVLRFVHSSINRSTITQDMWLYHKVPLIEFRTTVRWSEKHILLKAAFPLNVKTTSATYDIQFGTMHRPTKPRSPEDKAKFEVPAHEWVDLSDQKFGVSLLNDSKYGHDVREGTVRLSLIRSPRFPHEVDPGKLYGERHTDQGDHEFRYALFPHGGDWKQGETIRRAREFNVPFLVTPDSTPRPVPPFVTNLPKNLMISSVKKAEDGEELIVRIYEAHGHSSKTTLEFGYGIEKAFSCTLLEKDVAPLKSSRNKLVLKFAPHEIKTLKLKLKPFKPRT